jgi:hypothetical protein
MRTDLVDKVGNGAISIGTADLKLGITSTVVCWTITSSGKAR